jgi:hypothetical protein
MPLWRRSSQQVEEVEKLGEVENAVKHTGKRYCIMAELWPISSSPASTYLRRLLLTIVPEDFNANTRFDDKKAALLAHAQILQTMLGPDICKLINSSNIKHVVDLVRSLHNYIINTV